jgi:hypothetical protein
MPDTTPRTYDPRKFIFLFGGVPIMGYDEGTFISVKPSASRFTRKIGCDGAVARSKSADRTHEITMTLLQTSLSNDYLTSIQVIDELTNLGVVPASLTDLNGDTVMAWGAAWIKDMPEVTGAKEVGARAWVFDTGQIATEVIGGNLG